MCSAAILNGDSASVLDFSFVPLFVVFLFNYFLPSMISFSLFLHFRFYFSLLSCPFFFLIKALASESELTYFD